jgi:choline dehydrogenase-like flavoprotein
MEKIQDLINAAKIVIVGSGLASVSLAKRLSSYGLNVLILEGGDNDFKMNNELTDCTEYGHMENHWSNHWIRTVGGNSKIWGGQLAPLDEIDLIGGWPINKLGLDKYYKLALKFFNRQNFLNEEISITDSIFLKPFSKGSVLRINNDTEIIDKNIKIVINCHVLSIISKNRKMADSLRINFNGIEEQVSISNKVLVLGCGALGNAQILLQPNISSKISVGNESGLVGSFLMEHPYCVGATGLITSTFIDYSRKIAENNGALIDKNNNYSLNYRLSDTIRKKNQLQSSYFEFRFINKIINTKSNVIQFAEEKFGHDLLNVDIGILSEQCPNINNNVKINNFKNKVGLHKLTIQHAFSERDLFSILNSIKIFGKLIYQHKFGMIKINNTEIFRQIRGVGHIMGTTKMGNSIKNSVVDENLRVHGYGNLYIIGSSVFSTSGAANPTLTIVALSLRLADFIKGKLNYENKS